MEHGKREPVTVEDVGIPCLLLLSKRAVMDALVRNDVSIDPRGVALSYTGKESAPLVPLFLQIYNFDVVSWGKVLSYALENKRRVLAELPLQQAVRDNMTVEEYGFPLTKAVNYKEFHPDLLRFIISLPEGDNKILLWASVPETHRLVKHLLDELEMIVNIRIVDYSSLLLTALVHECRELDTLNA
ncbi:hypothetical protein BELL_0286g00100 [Botrytis elliptica]|uniref:Uncharacterized protein n=1 Tax=Botrytis elliptica TaxID=278938 RepID=A0A4Z1JT68_9HELO|nr:hypothetical protein EAE99_004063 [Botrytis elliptica]TGO74402.1 hypothetical protein BELL_0286g00100 [Botrytis elliptica]